MAVLLRPHMLTETHAGSDAEASATGLARAGAARQLSAKIYDSESAISR